jgi:hypothetical protein
MPIAALSLNVAWESTYAVHDLVTSVSIQAIVNLIWALADLAIVFTFFKFGQSQKQLEGAEGQNAPPTTTLYLHSTPS